MSDAFFHSSEELSGCRIDFANLSRGWQGRGGGPRRRRL